MKERALSAGTFRVKRNAFELLIVSQRSLQLEKQLPDLVEARNMKDKLYSDLLHLLGLKRLKL